jgi:F-type H+-transporting ATPase subunit b
MLALGWTFFVTLVNLLILFLILRVLLWKPVTKYIEGRQAKIKQEFEGIAKERSVNEQIRMSYDARMEGAKRESEEIVAEARQRAKLAGEAIIAQARAEAAQIVAAGRRTVEAERAEMVSSLRDETAALAVMAALKIAGGGIDAAAAKRLAREAISRAGEA